MFWSPYNGNTWNWNKTGGRLRLRAVCTRPTQFPGNTAKTKQQKNKQTNNKNRKYTKIRTFYRWYIVYVFKYIDVQIGYNVNLLNLFLKCRGQTLNIFISPSHILHFGTSWWVNEFYSCVGLLMFCTIKITLFQLNLVYALVLACAWGDYFFL